MSKIFELFGYRLDAWGSVAEENLRKAWCPFMNAECDGGGNRYLSTINLKENHKLATKFSPNKESVQVGICSLVIRENEQPWIVCPRRLLSLREKSSRLNHQEYIKNQLMKSMGLSNAEHYRVWSEVKIKVITTTEDEKEKFFDYTFDYVIAGSRKILLSEAAELIGYSEKQTQKIAEANGYTLAKRQELWIDNFPSDPITIVEIMTSSTSGGDKKKRTQIGMAFEDAILHPEQHNGPSINYRQVWARMVSQLIVKSEISITWNGKTIWLIQDVLADYISTSTALDLTKYISERPDEVNILAFSYGNTLNKSALDEIFPLENSNFYSGPISNGNVQNNNRNGFVEIVRIGTSPPKNYLWRALFLRHSYVEL